MEAEYNKAAKKIEKEDMTRSSQVFESLKSKLYIDDAEFRDIFKNKKINIAKRKLIKYILISIENRLTG